MQRKGTYKLALKTGIGEPFDTDTVTDLYRRLLCVLGNGDNLTDTFVTTDEGTGGKSTHRNRRRQGGHERDTGDGPVILLDVQIWRIQLV